MFNNSRFLQGLALLGFILVWGTITYFVLSFLDAPRFEPVTLSPHQTIVWEPKLLLKVNGGSDLVVRSVGRNFTVYDEAKNFICTGDVQPMLPSDSEPAFECALRPNADTSYKVSGYTEIYTATHASGQMQQHTPIIYIFVISVFGAIFDLAVLLLVMFIFKVI